VKDGFKGEVGFISNAKFAEQTDGSYGTVGTYPEAVLTLANVSYDTEDFTVIAGKQAIDLEWIGDYHQALVGVVKSVPNTTIIGGFTNKINGAGNDGALAEWAAINGGDGAMVLDLTHVMGDITLGAYYMQAPDLFSAYGAKVEAGIEGVGIVGKYASTTEDVDGTEDGNIMALDLSYSVDTLSLGAGYIVTDADGGSGSITALGDNINPFDNGDTYGVDTTAMYASVGTTIEGFELGLLAGTIDTAGAKDTEIDVSASWDCKLVKGVSMSALYVNYSADDSANDESYYSLQASYSF
jgi:hypothetical protein